MPKRRSNRAQKYAVIVLAIVATLFSAGLLHAQEPPQASPSNLWVWLTMLILLIIFGGVVLFMFTLQKKYMEACVKDNQLLIFSKSPAGLPEGTVRALISFIIIAISLYLAVLLFFQVAGNNSKYPEALSSLLGAVVGFYFGSKVGGKGDEAILTEQVKDLKTEQKESQSEALLKNIKKGIDMSKAVINILPEEQKKKYGSLVTKLEQGYATVQTLTKGGSVKDAVEQGQELFNLFRQENPARKIFTTAISSFGAVLGGSAPALAIVATLVAGGVKLVGSTYEKWKKRVLDVPITPAVLPLKAVDANTGFTLLLQSRIFKSAFSKELEANDRPFMTQFAQLLNQENVDAFYNTYKDRFDSSDHFDQGLQEFRRIALDNELAAETKDDPTIFSQAGGLEAFMKAIDRINAESEAKADLHRLTMAIEELQRQGEPVPTIFEKVQKEEKL